MDRHGGSAGPAWRGPSWAESAAANSVPQWATRAPTVPYVASLAIARDSRRKGLGRALVRACESIACREWGHDAMFLHCTTSNEQLLEMYRGFGYQQLPGDDQPGWVLALSGREATRYHTRPLDLKTAGHERGKETRSAEPRLSWKRSRSARSRSARGRRRKRRLPRSARRGQSARQWSRKSATRSSARVWRLRRPVPVRQSKDGSSKSGARSVASVTRQRKRTVRPGSARKSWRQAPPTSAHGSVVMRWPGCCAAAAHRRRGTLRARSGRQVHWLLLPAPVAHRLRRP